MRYWEDQFAVLTPLKRAGARRHYRPEDVEIVKTINRLLNEEGYTIKGARKFLAARRKPQEIDDTATLPSSRAPTSDQNMQDENILVLSELKSIRDRLSDALNEA
ncbi:MerR family transcriptional regulator [Parasphingorhabdus sp.]|uniref:MerR family transcriptional regulator n=1 Tax=Parasphingorhabdus sp. TaxID=2709688 RepID=UPI003FA70400